MNFLCIFCVIGSAIWYILGALPFIGYYANKLRLARLRKIREK